ncbi:endonuclease [Gracilibacillus oryzae]|uniref:Endonuclease n=1 Tax=Gracilibacillus oryzae TaxID=1672701 RepID=A0A7C8GQU9_9BACI|nr:endonuclease/exonuclease/phosphatase family protein [Gracilibacillus oryzae]KAB8126365.1 endonuclease [Gracilibacillus oryzae]
MRILSFNIHHGADESGSLELENIAEAIKRADADIIALQEVDCHFGNRSEWQNQIKKLGELLQMTYRFGANIDLPPIEGRSENRKFGNAILTKHPIVYYENYPLPDLGNEPRGLLYAEIKLGESSVHIFNTHLGLDKEERELQFEKISQILLPMSGPVILAGDFNVLPTDETLQMYLKQSNLLDSFQDSSALTFPTSSPQKRIDYLCHSTELDCIGRAVIDTVSSDHLPILAVYKIEHTS